MHLKIQDSCLIQNVQRVHKKITREEGVRLVKKYDTEFPKKYFNEFLDYVSLTEEEFWQIINNFRSPHLWKFDKSQWHLKHQVE